MLPFLKRQKEPAAAGLIVKTRAPDESKEDQDDPSAAHEACASEILHAISANDPGRLAEALKDMFNILDSGDSEESDSKHDYDSQNQKAGEQD